MQIKETQLDYSDVLIVPQPSKVNSRSDVSLIRTVGRIPWTGIPVVAANMATTGTLSIIPRMIYNHLQRMFSIFLRRLSAWIRHHSKHSTR
jgi:hypothetical protein